MSTSFLLYRKTMNPSGRGKAKTPLSRTDADGILYPGQTV